jgi:hypothetical protein
VTLDLPDRAAVVTARVVVKEGAVQSLSLDLPDVSLLGWPRPRGCG